MANKKLEDMTFEEAWKVFDDKEKCGICSECFASSNVWGETCDKVDRYAKRVVKDNLGKVIEKLQKQPSEHSSTEPFYQQTVDFMKKSGYTHCYMCGSELK